MSRRASILAIALALVPFGLLVMWYWDAGPGLDASDWAHYLLHARALVEGRPYSDTGYLFSALNPFLGPRIQPPGLPALLALVWKIGGGFNPLLFRVFMLVTCLPFFLLAGYYFGSRFGLVSGLFVILFVSVAPGIPHSATLILSDLGFCLLVWALIVTLDMEGEFTWRRVSAVFVLGSAMMSYRMVGVAVIPTLILFGLASYRRHGIRPLAPVFVWAAAGAIVVTRWGLVEAITRQINLASILDVSRPLLRVKLYRYALMESSLYPFHGALANQVYHLLALGLLAIGFVLWIRTAWRTAVWCFTLSYVAILLLVSAQTGRYAWPVYPVSAYLLFTGADRVLQLVRPRWARATREKGLLAAAAIVVLASGYELTRQPKPGDILREPSVQSLFAFLQSEATTSEVRAQFFRPGILTWVTRIPAMGLVTAEHAADTLHEMESQRITHVVVGDLDQERPNTEALINIVERSPCHFQRLYTKAEFSVYRFHSVCPAALTPNGT